MYDHVTDITHDIRERNPQDIHFWKGCSSCCHTRIELFPVEFDRISAAFRRLPISRQDAICRDAAHRWAEGICPLLLDDACSLYEYRPSICRTHGFPLYSGVRHETGTAVSVCVLNFTDGPTFGDQDLIDMDKLGMTLIAANLEYLRCCDTPTNSEETRSLLEALQDEPSAAPPPSLYES
ncbi:MAG: YkgJ family cysteine cluster protein [candidate division Zixibacteria bacterium]|nr:YkgJ family cysteine cluster protein [candidate division Zixibacteria bacterium]